MALPLPTRCPLCSGRIEVERVGCEQCHSHVEGHFELGWLGQLSAEQLRFVQVFLLCRGKIKDVEQALGLSYPTVVSRLDAIVSAMGEPAKTSAPPTTRSQLDVLDRLASGDIDVDEAERILRSPHPK